MMYLHATIFLVGILVGAVGTIFTAGSFPAPPKENKLLNKEYEEYIKYKNDRALTKKYKDYIKSLGIEL